MNYGIEIQLQKIKIVCLSACGAFFVIAHKVKTKADNKIKFCSKTGDYSTF